MSDRTYSSTVIKALDILDCFRDDSHALGVSEIASLTGMPVSSVHRSIRSLEFEGLIAQDPETKKYMLGPAFLLCAKKCRRLPDYEKIAVHFADQLGAKVERPST